MSAMTVHQMAERVAGLMQERLGVRGKGLAGKLRRGRRALPRKLRPEADLLAAAEAQAENPKLALQLDDARIAQAYDALVRHLSPMGRSDRRVAMLRSAAASAALALLVVAALFIAIAAWRGLV